MSIEQFAQPSFEVTHETEPSERMVAGFSSFGLAGLTAVDFLVEELKLEETGHISTDALPAITPFSDGTPRHHTRLFSRPDLDLTVLVNELFVPHWAADSFAKAILEWTDTNAVEEITILSGVPTPKGPDDHKVFYVVTEDYLGERLIKAEISAMGGGFLDGVNASLIGRGMDSDLRVGVFNTPVHEKVPDVQAALRLLEAFERMHGIDVDTQALEQFSGEVEQYYRELEARLKTVSQTEMPEDRMFM